MQHNVSVTKHWLYNPSGSAVLDLSSDELIFNVGAGEDNNSIEIGTKIVSNGGIKMNASRTKMDNIEMLPH